MFVLWKAYVVGDEHKKFVMQEAGKLHRAWRTNVRKVFLIDENGNIKEHPPSDYPEILQEHWDIFVARTQSAAFQKLSKENRKRALNPQYRYRKSRKGYARLEYDMEKLAQALPEEERQDRGRNDILFQSLSHLPEYSGRIRGLGFGIGDIREREKQDKQQADEIIGKQQPVEPVGNQQPKEAVEKQHPSVNDPCNPINFNTIPKAIIFCINSKVVGISSIEIYVASPSRKLVARGKLHNTDGDTVHGMKLLSGYVKVAIEVALVEDALLLIPVEDGEVSMIGQAVGTIVTWSFNLIKFVGDCKKIGDTYKNKDKKIQESAESVASPIKRRKKSIVSPNKNRNKIKYQESSPAVNSSEISQLKILQVYMTSMWAVDSVMEVSMGDKIFGKEYPEHMHAEHMHAEHMLEVINHEWLSASVITVYARYLYDKFISPAGLIHKIFFLSPHVSTDDIEGSKIAEILLQQRREVKDKLILAPYNFQNVHWVLLVIDLDAGNVYYLDSLGDDPSKHPQFKKKFNK
ncbi:hypothetical protein TSUD_399780 [Trifolium subterraneum]|uniref:Ubiquitin-like protease family profile domain-containing protein n=1 Tax=Trifolium subterraneum TaxID=3900 RepID=A0A2Z6NK94_TRISU|nr:hypothetical protein TSUD_399780 [Trifolium subterraneum]